MIQICNRKEKQIFVCVLSSSLLLHQILFLDIFDNYGVTYYTVSHMISSILWCCHIQWILTYHTHTHTPADKNTYEREKKKRKNDFASHQMLLYCSMCSCVNSIHKHHRNQFHDISLSISFFFLIKSNTSSIHWREWCDEK